ncbi:MAG: alpha/beta hydrolase, partial [Proteobacteria bacterium]|nr:alpha/beta hydrolase [Pseudomonadota bacterium]
MNAHDSVLLWPEGAPGATGTGWSDQPGLTIHRAGEHHATGAAVIVNPGGGFSKLASDNEGLHVALWLNAMGVSAFVLRYRLRPDYEPSDACLDARRAIRYVRHHAESLGVDPNRVGMIGFSAGAILAMQTATRYDPGDPAAVDPIDRASSRPDFS